MPLLGSLSPADRDRLLPAWGTTGRKLMQPLTGHDSSPRYWALASTNSASSHHQNPVGTLLGGLGPARPSLGAGRAVPLEDALGPGTCPAQDVPSPGPARASPGPRHRQHRFIPRSACQTLPVLSVASVPGFCHSAELWSSPAFLLAS